MSIKTLVLSGGAIHDFKGCGAEINSIMESDDRFDVTYVEDDLEALTTLPDYKLLVFYYTVGEITPEQRDALLGWVYAGGGYAGVHSAADSFRGCQEYRHMVGGWFVTHPKYRSYTVSVGDPEHPIMAPVCTDETKIAEGAFEFQVDDEMYVTDYDPRVSVLASALWKGGLVPVIWTKTWGEGRVFYNALGHNPESCQDANFAKLLTAGAAWAAGS